ncbi:alpha/beta fold hydrolase [Beduini massiliensis]|uniref:alpha/beta fold hydrolase n=1 Tax=Beduini massiliensis TaxID=1585974 RepID=UPI00059A8D81|nr:alpha/beta hydrolase [Beduini massiliensis]
MKTYTIKSHDLNLQVYALGNMQAKTAVLFLHGGPGSGAMPVIKLPAFQVFEKDYLCLHFDQRGSGQSNYDLKEGLPIELITDDVLAVVKDSKDRYDFTSLFLWGGSFGGCLASLCMERFSGEFKGIVLSSPAITFSREQALDFYKRMSAPYQKRMDISIQDQLQALNNDAPEAFFALSKVRDFIFSPQNTIHSIMHIAAMSSWFFNHVFPCLFDNTSIPTLILQGKNDPICLYQNIDQQIRKTNNALIHYHLLESCGHAVFEDQKDLFVDLIKQFIEDTLSRSSFPIHF